MAPAWDQRPSWRTHQEALDHLERCYQMKAHWELELIRAIQRVDELRSHEEMGYESVPDYVTAYFGVGYMRACEIYEVAMALVELPALTSAFERGDLSYDHLRALVQVATPQNEMELLERARGRSVAQVFRMMRKLLPVTKEQSVEAHKGRRLEMSWSEDQRVLLFNGYLPEDMGAKFEKAIDAAARYVAPDPIWEEGEDTPTPKAVRRADALYQMVAESASGDQVLGPRAQVVVHVDAHTLIHRDGTAEFESGGVIGPATVDRLLCDCSLASVVEDSEGKPLGFGRTRRTAPPKMKRELIRRDGGCCWPGCRRRKLVDAHHIDEYGRDKGETNWDNMVLFCELHHYMVHEGGYRVIGVPPKITILPPQTYLPPIKYGPPPMKEEVLRDFERELEKARAP